MCADTVPDSKSNVWDIMPQVAIGAKFAHVAKNVNSVIRDKNKIAIAFIQRASQVVNDVIHRGKGNRIRRTSNNYICMRAGIVACRMLVSKWRAKLMLAWFMLCAHMQVVDYQPLAWGAPISD